MSTVLLEARQLGRRHPEGHGWLLSDVSLAIRAGERIALEGPSGAGKTLLLRALVLLDPPDTGEIRWQGQVIRSDRCLVFRRQAIYLHQRPAVSEDTVESALMKPLTLSAHQQRCFDRGRIIKYLQSLGRDASFLAKRPRDLSGGELQVTALLRALQLDPVVLLLDEPTTALDAPTAEAVEGLISGWLDEAPDRRAFVWVGHDQAQSLRVTQRRLLIRSGRVEDEGS